jgi:hypothetical protein
MEGVAGMGVDGGAQVARGEEEVFVNRPYNKVSTIKISGSRGVYNKFHAYFLY